ncbi:glycoside hydrolase family 3 protein [Streptacidiphilus sp. ASG 303]|uniref:glycoside hydrolase family 3 N-terminal domain-containing protein n=1 Tax=Streptacidiphilus sp. ASG 303 TaxID=2896847 RepID=UPI001E2F2F08|nr:glycoside hydrolase family 3 N-terminal domain-containing protein [Streptacidiphilus sp. ASG 303]MCD0483703.1 glycoside hydrolase family 3 protein [Streptacidiphilus sp. ASG 303]
MTSQRTSSRGSRGKRGLWPVLPLTVSLAAAGLGVAQAEPANPAPVTGVRAVTCVDRVFAGMTGPQRVGQLFMGGVNASLPDRKRLQVLRQYHVGSVFLAGRSKSGTRATKSLADGLQAKADTVAGHRVGLLVSTDQEGGQVQVLSGPGFSTIPSGLVQGSWSTSKLRSSAALWAKQLKAAGVNLNLAPVTDVVPSSLGRNNAPIGRYDREYGHTATTVASHSGAFAAGFAQSKVLATLKHFPGLGYVRGNTDTTANVVDSVTTGSSASITPFRSGIKAGAPFVMISLATYSRIDSKHRAVFSSAVIQKLLRTSLGFRGVVVSDDLGNAVAVRSVLPADRAVAFLNAGGDQVLTVEPNLIPAMAKAVQARMAHNPAFRLKADRSVHRILAAKQKAGLLYCG